MATLTICRFDMDEIETILKHFAYAPETGAFTKIAKTGRKGAVGPYRCMTSSTGYATISICGKKRFAHRVAWVLAYGHWPDGHIDHINGDKKDNRLCNLRLVDHSGNMQNLRKAKSSSAHGFLGASFYKPLSKWKARIVVARKEYHIGYYDTPEEAHAAYLERKRQVHATCSI